MKSGEPPSSNGTSPRRGLRQPIHVRVWCVCALAADFSLGPHTPTPPYPLTRGSLPGRGLGGPHTHTHTHTCGSLSGRGLGVLQHHFELRNDLRVWQRLACACACARVNFLVWAVLHTNTHICMYLGSTGRIGLSKAHDAHTHAPLPHTHLGTLAPKAS